MSWRLGGRGLRLRQDNQPQSKGSFEWAEFHVRWLPSVAFSGNGASALDARGHMAVSIPESDWKKFRRLREVALERFCDRTLQEIAKLAADASSGLHQRYLKIYTLMQRRDREMGRAFDDPRRSWALQQLSVMYALGLLEVGELDAFTDKTREVVKFLSTR